MAADRRTAMTSPPASKAAKPAARKTPAPAAAVAAVAVSPVKTAAVKAPVVKPPAATPLAKAPGAKPAAAKPVVAKPLAAKPVAGKPALAKSAAPPTTAEKMPVAKPPKGDYVLEDQVGFHLRRAHQRASLIFNEVMMRFDMTPTQFAALAKVDDEGSISQNHLGRLTAMDPSTILGVIGRLARQGLVHLRSTPGDQRLTMIELTLDGQKRVAEMKAVAADVSRRTLAPLKPADAKLLTELLARIG